MRKLFAIALFLGLGNFLSAQAFTGPGDQKIQLGLVPYGYGQGLKATYDYGLIEYVSIGGGIEVLFDEPSDQDRNFYVFGRANFHFGEFLVLPNEMDAYVGADLGINGEDIGIGAYAGFRYYPFNETWGFFAEVGSRASIGVSYNF